MNKNELINWIIANTPGRIFLNLEDVAHIATCLSMIDNYFKNGVPLYDDFLEAVTKRDFYNALKLSDDCNKAAIYIYAMWMYNFAPAPEFIT